MPITPQEARRHRRAARDRARRQGRELDTDRLDVAPVRKHVRKLLADPDWGSYSNIAAASGLRRSTVRAVAHSQKYLQRHTHDALMKVDRDALRAVAAFIPARMAWQRVSSMQAQGWTLDWQAQQLGWRADVLWHVRAQKHVTRRAFEDIEVLYERVGDRTGPSRTASWHAHRQGWLPGRFYDEDSNLRPDYIPEEDLADIDADWARAEIARRRSRRRPRHLGPDRLADRREERDSKARQRIEALRLSLAGVGMDDIADRLGVDGAIVQRYRTEAGLRFRYYATTGQSEPHPDSAERAREVRKVLADHVNHGRDPFATARKLGMMSSSKWDFDARQGRDEGKGMAEAS